MSPYSFNSQEDTIIHGEEIQGILAKKGINSFEDIYQFLPETGVNTNKIREEIINLVVKKVFNLLNTLYSSENEISVEEIANEIGDSIYTDTDIESSDKTGSEAGAASKLTKQLVKVILDNGK